MKTVVLSLAAWWSIGGVSLSPSVAAAPSATPVVDLANAGLVTAPSIVRRDHPCKINHPKGATIQAIYVDAQGEWVFLPEQHFVRGESSTILAAPPSTYLITTGDSKMIKVVGDGKPRPRPDPPDPRPQPDPRPDPSPGPEPGPAPLVAEWAIWIEEQQDRASHVEATLVMNSAATRRNLEDRGLKVRIYDDDQPEAKWMADAVGSVRPAFLLLDANSEMRFFPAPKTSDGLEKIIRENVVR